MLVPWASAHTSGLALLWSGLRSHLPYRVFRALRRYLQLLQGPCLSTLGHALDCVNVLFWFGLAL